MASLGTDRARVLGFPRGRGEGDERPQEAMPTDEPTPATRTETSYLDFGHPTVRAFVDRATEGSRTDRERAIMLFRAVRDDIRYDPYATDLSPEGLKASTTIARGRAFCVPKAALYAATLRAVGIPSRLGFADVTNHLATKRLLEMTRTEVFAFHGNTEVWLAGRWLKATPAFDAALCARFEVDPLEFDGEHDALLQASNKPGKPFMSYIRDRGVFDDLPREAMLGAFREIYPHWFVSEASAP